MKTAALFAAALVVAGCGGHKPSAHSRANAALLDRLPVYPGSTAPKTAQGDAYGVRDWSLPPDATASRVIDWYVRRLGLRGWRISGKSFATIRASRHGSSVSIGVRNRTLEVVANA